MERLPTNGAQKWLIIGKMSPQMLFKGTFLTERLGTVIAFMFSIIFMFDGDVSVHFGFQCELFLAKFTQITIYVEIRMFLKGVVGNKTFLTQLANEFFDFLLYRCRLVQIIGILNQSFRMFFYLTLIDTVFISTDLRSFVLMVLSGMDNTVSL